MVFNQELQTALQEQLNQLDDLFKLVEGISERLKAAIDKVNADNQWFEQLVEKVFSFKHTTHSWLKDAALERMVNHVPSREGSKKGSKSSSS